MTDSSYQQTAAASARGDKPRAELMEMESRCTENGTCIRKWQQQDCGPLRPTWPSSQSRLRFAKQGKSHKVLSQTTVQEMFEAAI